MKLFAALISISLFAQSDPVSRGIRTGSQIRALDSLSGALDAEANLANTTAAIMSEQQRQEALTALKASGETDPPCDVLWFASRTAAHVSNSTADVWLDARDQVGLKLRTLGAKPCRLLTDRRRLLLPRQPGLVDLLDRAKEDGAKYVLRLVVDRPTFAWIKLTLMCYSVDGELLWQESASHGGGVSGNGAPIKASEKLAKELKKHAKEEPFTSIATTK